MIINGLILRICNDADINDGFLRKLTSMINQVFLVAEAEIWKENHQRIDRRMLAEMIKKREIMVAEVNNILAACVHIKLLNHSVAK